MPKEKKRTFDDDDLFDRRPYAEFLKNLILNCDSYHRDDDVKAYTIALDSPWGTGKSVFLEKFEAMLEQDCQDQLRVVHYNAWENDFWDNAFEPFADTVFSHPLFASPLADQTEGSAGKKFGEALKHLALAFAKKRLDDYFDSPEMMNALEAAMSAAGTATSQKTPMISPKYSAYKMSLKTIQDAMEKVLMENDQEDSPKPVKLVIIIDELDRCRPTFAIETLEIVKHVMDVPNVVYLFALDVQQLGAAIKKVYGAETDATGYLMRFFSYYSRMPEANIEVLLQESLKEVTEIQSYQELIPELASIANVMSLNARDLETVSKVFQIMIDTFLRTYHCSMAYKLYWTLLCSKYKNPSEFNNQMNGIFDESIPKGVAAVLGKSSSKFNLTVPLKKIHDNKPLNNQRFDIFGDGKNIDSTKWAIVGVQKESENRISLFVTTQPEVASFATKISVRPTETVSGILFFPDLLKWDEIKTLTPGQFLLKQLEMFDFIREPSK